MYFSQKVIESFLMEKCLSSNEKPMESKAFELKLDYTFLATSMYKNCDTADSNTDSKNIQNRSLKTQVSRVVTGMYVSRKTEQHIHT